MNKGAKKVRWGILSTALIGTGQVIPAMQRGTFSEVTGIASRDKTKAAEWAEKLGISKAYGSYEAILADPDIDAIYNPLPNHLHVPWSLKAIEAGKHVLCEKPVALTSGEAQQLVDAANAHPELKVMEAFMYRHNPQWQKAKDLTTSGGVGDLRTVQTAFSYFNDDGDNIRNRADIGGGGLMDIGCYCISLSRFLFDREPQRLVAMVENDPRFDVDRLSLAILDFGDGQTSSFVCSTQLVPYQRVNILGTSGRVEIEIPFNAPKTEPCRLWHQQGEGPTAELPPQEILMPACDQYTVQGDLMSQAILNDTPVPTPIEDAVANMKVIEAIVESGRSGGWVNVSK
ncbi:MAG: putative dehydrogenase [Verrucomicrobiales bacterium]|jgi:predicted dehydrogenase